MMIRLTQAVLLTATAANTVSATFSNGDFCGVTSRKFLNYDYRSDYLVAGQKGCELNGSNDETIHSNCFCAPNLVDGESLSEWQWQCDGVVNFGPVEGKTCPETVPVPKGLGLLDVVERNLQQTDKDKIVSIGTESQQEKISVPCDTSIHPTGRPGDEVCPYSDCDEGGDHSAICACVDLAKYGMGEGQEWVCMHATCSCGGEEEKANDAANQDEDAMEAAEQGEESSSNVAVDPVQEESNDVDDASNESPVQEESKESPDDASGGASITAALSMVALLAATAQLAL